MKFQEMGDPDTDAIRVVRTVPLHRLRREAQGALGPIYPHVALRRPRSVNVRFASPYQNFIFLNVIVSLLEK